MTAALLALVALVYFLPERLPGMVGGTQAAWEYVAYGTEAAAVWAVLGVLLRRTPAVVVCTWATFEALQRPLCRLMLPMDRAPRLPPGQTLCEAAVGAPMAWVGFAAAAMVAAYISGRADRAS